MLALCVPRPALARIAYPALLALLLFPAASLADPLFGQPKEDFAARREAVRKAAEGAVVLYRGPTESGEMGRTRFRTDNALMYLTGVEAPGAWLALLPPGDPTGKKEILFLPSRGARSRWTSPTPGPGTETEQATGIESVQSTRSMWEVLTPSLKAAKRVQIIGPVGERGRYTPAGETEARIKAINPDTDVSGRAATLTYPLRWKKSEGEIANLRAAIAATRDAQFAAARAIVDGATELAVEGAILAAFRAGGAPREGFPCIVGSGPNSCILHYLSGNRVMRKGEMVVVDIGAEYNYYSADITRTFPVGGRFTPRQREIYQLVLDCQKACEKAVVPGKTTLSELNEVAREFFRSSPLRARDSAGNLLTMENFFFHGLSHWLGMDVHDVSGGSGVLEPGVVFTIEPGLYIDTENIGVRIEDDYLVTANGLVKLSADLPSDPADIEAMMRGTLRPPKR